MRIFWKKAVKSPHRQEIRPQIGLQRLGTSSSGPRVVTLTY